MEATEAREMIHEDYWKGLISQERADEMLRQIDRKETPVAINVNITNELARAVGMLANRHPDRSIQIEWRETSDHREWFVTASDGVNDTVYVVDDETGTNMPLNSHDLALYDSGQPVLT